MTILLLAGYHVNTNILPYYYKMSLASWAHICFHIITSSFWPVNIEVQFNVAQLKSLLIVH